MNLNSFLLKVNLYNMIIFIAMEPSKITEELKEALEEIKEEELMRRWTHLNFARRIRSM